MTANFSSPAFFPFPLELNGASSSSIACPIFFNNGDDQQKGFYRNDSQMLNIQCRNDQNQVMAKELLLGSSSSSCDLDHHPRNDQILKFSIWKKKKEEDPDPDHETNKWMSSKMRIMKKMMNNNNTDHDHRGHVMAKKFLSSSSSETDINSGNVPTDNGSPIRVCSDCNTTKTPLWRSGPRGPKSLCNACGIRQRKARREAMAAAAASGGAVLEVSKPFATTHNYKVVPKEKKSNNNDKDRVLLPFKKRCKLMTSTTPNRSGSNNKKLCFEDLRMILSKNSTYNQRVFPQDEREAAILLMALSYGLVSG